jgi:hypothetical protein
MAEPVRQWTPVLNRRFSFAAPSDLDLLELDWQAVEPAELNEAPYHSVKARLGENLPDNLQVHSVRSANLPSWLRDLCIAPGEGLHELMVRTSPSGCGTYEDLPLVASGATSETLLVVVEYRGENVIVYRCLFGGEAQ